VRARGTQGAGSRRSLRRQGDDESRPIPAAPAAGTFNLSATCAWQREVASRPVRGPSRLRLTHGLRNAVMISEVMYHPPRAARRHLHAVEPAALAPIGNGIHRHIEQRRCCLRTITAIATLSRWAGDGSNGHPLLIP